MGTGLPLRIDLVRWIDEKVAREGQERLLVYGQRMRLVRLSEAAIFNMRVGFNERKRLSKRGAVRRRGQYYNTCDGGSNVCLAVRVRCFLRAAYTQKSRYDEISAMIPWDGSCRLCKENVDGIDLDAFQVFQTISSIAARITAVSLYITHGTYPPLD